MARGAALWGHVVMHLPGPAYARVYLRSRYSQSQFYGRSKISEH